MRSILANPSVKHQVILLAEDENPQKRAEEEAQKSSPKAPPAPAHNLTVTHANWGTLGSSEEGAMVVFAVVGTVVVIAWVAYFPMRAYQSIKEGREKYRFHHTVMLNANVVSGNDNFREGYFTGPMYNFFLENKNDSNAQTGIWLESGYFNMNEKRHEQRRLEGGYWLAGPSLRSSIKGFEGFLKLDLLAGSSFDRDLGLVTKAQASFNFADFGYLFGLNMGALHARVNKNKGPADDISNTVYLIGISVGKSF